jgi:hypothetical protein
MSGSSILLFSILMCLCLGTVIVAVGAGIYFYVRRSVAAVNRAWGDLGVGTGLKLKPAALFSQPELNGMFRQRPIHLYTYNAGTQGNRITYTAVALTVNNPTNSKMEITPSGTGGKFFRKMLNLQDTEIGNPAFDARFVIKGNPPDFALKFLGEARVQMEIMNIPDAFRIELKGSSLKYSKRDLEENADFLTKLFNTLSDLADRLEGN